MAGIYLHIPFCKQACHYCNFHFSTTLARMEEMTDALVREIELQKNYLGGAAISSIYLGGGTPSLLKISALNRLFEAVYRLHGVEENAEITLEANPDDLDAEKLSDLKNYTPVNRLSIGIQSFFENDLRWMNRAHSARQARISIEDALRLGFPDLTVDLIYGSPTTSDEQWAKNLEILAEYPVPHLSCYCLTVEDGTALGSWVKKGKQAPPDEGRASFQFEFLMDWAPQNGFEQYEISNFARDGRYARHNSAYWRGAPYLGIGPSAHSFDGDSRQWNAAHNGRYIAALQEDRIPFEREMLTPEMRYNEYIMTGLRTKWGVDPGRLAHFGVDGLSRFEKDVDPYLTSGDVLLSEGKYLLSRSGKLLADYIASELFV